MKVECYDSLDAPVFIWDKVHSTGDVSWLLVKKRKVTVKLREHLTRVWEGIYEEYFKEFGKSERFKAILDKTKEIILLYCKLHETKDRFILTWIAIAEDELNELKSGIEKFNIMQSKMAIESRMKFQINMQSTSIREFYSYLKNLK